jgi:hypothetical protein
LTPLGTAGPDWVTDGHEFGRRGAIRREATNSSG